MAGRDMFSGSLDHFILCTTSLPCHGLDSEQIYQKITKSWCSHQQRTHGLHFTCSWHGWKGHNSKTSLSLSCFRSILFSSSWIPVYLQVSSFTDHYHTSPSPSFSFLAHLLFLLIRLFSLSLSPFADHVPRTQSPRTDPAPGFDTEEKICLKKTFISIPFFDYILLIFEWILLENDFKWIDSISRFVRMTHTRFQRFSNYY